MLSWLYPARVPEPEVMDEAGEVDAYADAAAQAHLDAIDDTFIEHVLRLGVRKGHALDVGCGPGSIVLKLAKRLPELELVGIDRSELMLEEGLDKVRQLGLVGRVWFNYGEAGRLDFPDRSFDLVMCNSVLHHLAQPARALREVARVVRPGGAVLIRDLRRPTRLAMPLHLRWHGRRYSGKMLELFRASVRAAYTRVELEGLLKESGLSGARTFRFGSAHIGIERPMTLGGSR